MERVTQSSMKTLAVWQPWASLIIIGAKPWAFRGRSYLAYVNHPQPGERIAIHASARPVRPARDHDVSPNIEVKDLLFRLGRGIDTTDLIVERAEQLLNRVCAAHKYQALPLGAVLGIAVIGEPKRADDIFGRRPEAADADYNWAWPLRDVEKFDVPVPARGLQGFWKWSPPAAQCQNGLTRRAGDP
jgi:hypothetical protein